MELQPLGDSALTIKWGDDLAEATFLRVERLAAALRARSLRGVLDVVPSYNTVSVFYDPMLWSKTDQSAYDHLRTIVSEIALQENVSAPESRDQEAAPRRVEIPVCYGGEYGPDLAEVIRHTGLTEDKLVSLHTQAQYQVRAIGFSAGFPYLSGLRPELFTPRRASPRTAVPAGSVGIGGAQTGVYPRSSPGGWMLIGRTPLVLFDP